MWRANPSAYYILMVQDPVKRRGIDEDEMKTLYPKTYAYLKRFEGILCDRKSRGVSDMIKNGAPFYTMFAISDYTFAPYKVVWPWISVGLKAAVVNSFENKVVCPEHNTSFLEADSPDVAHFVCACLNSNIGDFTIRAFSSGGGGGIASPAVLQKIRIPKFDSSNKIHQELASLSQRAHQAAAAGEQETPSFIKNRIDELAAELWGLTPEELKEIQESLAELKSLRRGSVRSTG